MGLSRGELLRVRILFAGLGVVPVFLAGWLGWLQVLQAGELRRGKDRQPLRLSDDLADAQRDAFESIPAPRGTIVDRGGRVLALDCEVYQVRARLRVPTESRRDCAAVRQWIDVIAGEFAAALALDPRLADRAEARRAQRQRLDERLARAFALDRLPASGKVPDDAVLRADILIDSDVDVLAVVEALRKIDNTRDSVALDLQIDHRRVHPDDDIPWGLVGFVEDVKVQDPRNPKGSIYVPVGKMGMESLAAMLPGEASARRFFRDSVERPYFFGAGAERAAPAVLHSTIDLELQKEATRELATQAKAAGADGKAREPQWGALVLIDIPTGDVLAAASWQRDVRDAKAAAFTPLQNLYEPGSIVKPLVFGYALAKAGLDWNDTFDCTSTGGDHHRTVEETGRVVRDDHACGPLTPHGILVNSSNIGAVKVGALLSREQWRGYMDFIGVGRPLGLNLPFERVGMWNDESFDEKRPLKAFRKWTGSSFSFGYEHQVSALQMARAYLTLLSGARRELRLYRAVEMDGQRHEVPAPPIGSQELGPAVVEAVRAAMVDVVSNDPHATGYHLHRRMLKDLGLDLHGLIAGKTGTAVSSTVIKGKGTVRVKNASFVGYAPADAPRFLAVCVLQRDDDARFYGGSYAAPPVTRLLLTAMKVDELRRERQEPQVGAIPGGSGWSGQAPGTTEAGR